MKFNQVIKTDKGMPQAYYCSNMRSCDGGMVADIRLYKTEEKKAGTPTANLSTIKSWTANGDGIWGTDDANTYFYGDEFVRATTLDGVSIVADFDNNIAIIDKQYIHRSERTTLASTLSSAATSMELADASDFPASGQVFIADGWPEVINYTGKSGNTLTGLSRGIDYTTDRTHSAGTSVTWFDDNWADLGESLNDRPSVQHENHVFVGNGHYIAGWDDGDVGTFSTNKLDLPAGYTVVALTSVLMGNQKMVLIGANRQYESSIFVWDGEDTTWQQRIPMEGKIYCMDKNYIGVPGGIYRIEGGRTILEAPFPGDGGGVYSTLTPLCLLATTENIYVGASGNATTQSAKSGLLIWNIQKKEWLFSPLASGDPNNEQIESMISTSGKSLLAGEGNYVDKLRVEEPAAQSFYQVYFAPQTGKRLKLTDITLNVDTLRHSDNAYSGQLEFDIIVRVCAN